MRFIAALSTFVLLSAAGMNGSAEASLLDKFITNPLAKMGKLFKETTKSAKDSTKSMPALSFKFKPVGPLKPSDHPEATDKGKGICTTRKSKDYVEALLTRSEDKDIASGLYCGREVADLILDLSSDDILASPKNLAALLPQLMLRRDRFGKLYSKRGMTETYLKCMVDIRADFKTSSETEKFYPCLGKNGCDEKDFEAYKTKLQSLESCKKIPGMDKQAADFVDELVKYWKEGSKVYGEDKLKIDEAVHSGTYQALIDSPYVSEVAAQSVRALTPDEKAKAHAQIGSVLDQIKRISAILNGKLEATYTTSEEAYKTLAAEKLQADNKALADSLVASAVKPAQ